MLKIIRLKLIHFLRFLYLIKFNQFEIEIKILKDIIDKESICLDIGCCHGSYSRILSKYSKYVYAFEAEKKNFKYLKTVMKQNNISLHNLAVSNKNGYTNLYIPLVNNKQNTAMSSLIKNSKNEDLLINNYNGIVSQKIKTITLDNFIKAKKVQKIDFIKIDVEGYELPILQKSHKILKNFRPIMMIEILKDQKKNYIKVFKLMQKYNYSTFYLCRKTFKFRKCSYKNIENFQSKKKQLNKNKNFFNQSYIHNFFFLPKERISTKKNLISK